ncbi:MAG: glycosyltransferase [Candidatus Omnitrophica bacterium]|nr:glycosyltransferase [Candidatus Omnitrophota bacterium]
MLRIAFIIPTKDRELELGRLLRSLQGQCRLPEEIIIVDASAEFKGQAYVTGGFGPLVIKHMKAHRACLPAQRNQGLEHVSSGIELVCFLDDDIVFCEGAVKEMASFWDQASVDVAGAVFNIINEKFPTAGVYFKMIFGTGSVQRGAVLPSGYNSLMCPAIETAYVQWLFGGATVWRRKIFSEFLFDEWFEGTGLCEDLDFSYRVGRRYRLVVVATARVEHLSGDVSRRRNFWFGRSQLRNRYYFVKKNQLSIGMCLWASAGQMLENIVLGVARRNVGYWQRALGNFTGFFELWTINVVSGHRKQQS